MRAMKQLGGVEERRAETDKIIGWGPTTGSGKEEIWKDLEGSLEVSASIDVAHRKRTGMAIIIVAILA